MKVALIQLNAGPDKKANLRRCCAFVREAAGRGAKFILLPEMFNFRGTLTGPRDVHNAVEKIPGESTQALLDLARTLKRFILAGSLMEKARGKSKAFNTSVLINPAGKIVQRYRKIHLFDAALGKTKVKESNFFLAGAAPVLASVDGFRLGMSICYDVRFPELYRTYGRRGADILAVPSSFTRATGQAHWEVLLRARAIENLCYVLAPGQVGVDGKGVRAHGNSLVVNPWGEVLARGSGHREEIVYADIEHAVLKKSRQILPGIQKIN